MISQTLNTFDKSVQQIQKCFAPFEISCMDCAESLFYSQEKMIILDTHSFKSNAQQSINEIIWTNCKIDEHNMCKHKNPYISQFIGSIIIFSFSVPVSLMIKKVETIWGKELVYKAHIRESLQGGNSSDQAFFGNSN